MTGKEFNEWLTDAAAQHRQLMEEAGFLQVVLPVVCGSAVALPRFALARTVLHP